MNKKYEGVNSVFSFEASLFVDLMGTIDFCVVLVGFPQQKLLL
jgi:hypothetical protein